MTYTYQNIRSRREVVVYTRLDRVMIRRIAQCVNKANLDNVSRTKAYLDFYQSHKEIRWSLLASMVSRNAGWNMTDLYKPSYKKLLTKRFLTVLFHTYERPNWLIFSDAFPQLLIYALSKRKKQPMFHLLKAFNVSVFMELAWLAFWEHGNRIKLSHCQIINEQKLIEHPVIQQSFYGSKIFHSFVYRLQEWWHNNAVIFPTERGALYGFSVYRFTHVNKRISLGKQLDWLLHDSPERHAIVSFATKVEHTGSRHDYEIFLKRGIISSPFILRDVYQTVSHHRKPTDDWFDGQITEGWFDDLIIPTYDLTAWYLNKQRQMNFLGRVVEGLGINCR